MGLPLETRSLSLENAAEIVVSREYVVSALCKKKNNNRTLMLPSYEIKSLLEMTDAFHPFILKHNSKNDKGP